MVILLLLKMLCIEQQSAHELIEPEKTCTHTQSQRDRFNAVTVWPDLYDLARYSIYTYVAHQPTFLIHMQQEDLGYASSDLEPPQK